MISLWSNEALFCKTFVSGSHREKNGAMDHKTQVNVDSRAEALKRPKFKFILK